MKTLALCGIQLRISLRCTTIDLRERRKQHFPLFFADADTCICDLKEQGHLVLRCPATAFIYRTTNANFALVGELHAKSQ